jgi:hypothetical protein
MKQAAEALLEKCGLLKRSKVRDVWKSVKWTTTWLVSSGSPAVAAGNSEICLRQDSKEQSPVPLIKAFGTIVHRQLAPKKQAAWDRKLIRLTKDQALEFAHRISMYEDYQSVVTSYLGAVDRLAAIHLCNALIASRVDYTETVNVDIFEWPQTAPMAKGQKPYSLLPVWGAYAPHLLDLGDAMLDYAQREFGSILEMSLRNAAKRLFDDVLGEN